MGLKGVHLQVNCRVLGLVLPPACAVGGIDPRLYVLMEIRTEPAISLLYKHS
eukprot:SAG11_NODE_211_length_12281_cov_11.326219_2_plen_52_part_00